MPDDRERPQHDDEAAAIPDLHSLPLEAVLHADDSALGNALRRAIQEVGTPSEPYAAHNST